jgi:uncharacterized cysteine cluster protein YcgN (CxxCxxCC family)
MTAMQDPRCRQCGRCCWNWKEDKPEDRCEHLADDLRTCLVYGDLARVRPECVAFPTPAQACDLPEDCGYMLAWKRDGLI